LIAGVVRKAFERISQSDYAPAYPPVDTLEEVVEPEPTHEAVGVVDLVRAGLLPIGTVLTPVTDTVDAVAEIDEYGRIVLNDAIYDTPSGAARQATGGSINGWTFWLADTPAGLRRLEVIRDEFRSGNVELDTLIGAQRSPSQ
jgi:hypothetical protein